MNEETLRNKLPIGQNERILKVVRHHWFAYVSVYLGSAFVIFMILIVIGLINVNKADLQLSASAATVISLSGVLFAGIVGLFSLLPAWLKKQEYLVLTEEAIMQMNKPSLFTNKVSQLNLVHISDVSVNQDALGTLLGYGRIVIETPGEQDNYTFTVIPDARAVATAIIEAHENYAAALESGQIKTTLGQQPPTKGKAWRPEPVMPEDHQAKKSDHSKAASAIGHIASEEAEGSN